jgi:3-hydroxyisobutyrate dehydrogenase-like beta-hydroxyacid dehydrogenase
MGLGIGFAGLGAMGFGMASRLVIKGHKVTGYDVFEPSLDKFKAAGGDIASSPTEAARQKDYFICMVANAQQVDSVLFDPENGAVHSMLYIAPRRRTDLTDYPALAPHATLIICSTVPAAYLQEIHTKLETYNRSDIHLLDSPVSGGTLRAANGTLTILVSGDPAALKQGNPVLTELCEKLFVIPGGVGSASNVKMVNQLLAGVHIAAAAEAMGLAARMGLDTRQVYESVVKGRGSSWMFGDRVPHMLEGEWQPCSALDIFVKDLGIVTSSARSHHFPLPLSAAAEQLYIFASGQGYGREDDAGIVRIYLPRTPTAVRDCAGDGRVDAAESSVGIISQLLEGIHIVAAAEAMALATKIGLDGQSLYEIIRHAAGGSRMFEHVAPAMLKADWKSESAVERRIKSLVGWKIELKGVEY